MEHYGTVGYSLCSSIFRDHQRSGSVGNSGASPTKMVVTLDSVGTSVEFLACLILDGSKIRRFRWGYQVAATLEKDLEDERRERREQAYWRIA